MMTTTKKLSQPKIRPFLKSWLEKSNPEDKTRLICSVVFNKRNEILSMFAARNIEVLVEMPPVFTPDFDEKGRPTEKHYIFSVNATAEQIQNLVSDPLIVYCELPVSFHHLYKQEETPEA